MTMRWSTALGLCICTWACGSDAEPAPDASVDAAPMLPDAGAEDAGGVDAGVPDSGGCSEGCGFVEVALGFVTSCARRENGEVWCWGHNLNGEVGDGRERHAGADCTRQVDVQVQDCPAPSRTLLASSVRRLSAKGGRNACAITEGQETWCWGREIIAEREGEQPNRRFVPERIAGFERASDVSNGSSHACAVIAGSVWCYGFNSSGELGNGDQMERRSPSAPTEVVGLDATVSGVEVSSLDARGGIDAFACAHSQERLWCWGSNQSGQLAEAAVATTCMPDLTTQYPCTSTALEVPLPSGVTVEHLSLGARHACFVSTDGAVYCWGENAVGQLGTGDTVSRGVPTANGLTGAVEVTAGFRHTCARLADGSIRCWGGNEDGPLGDGQFDHGQSCSSQGDVIDCSPTPVTVIAVDDAVSVAAGFEHTCAARASGEVWCWGWNDRRGLGDGTEERRATPARVLGLGN